MGKETQSSLFILLINMNLLIYSEYLIDLQCILFLQKMFRFHISNFLGGLHHTALHYQTKNYSSMYLQTQSIVIWAMNKQPSVGWSLYNYQNTKCFSSRIQNRISEFLSIQKENIKVWTIGISPQNSNNKFLIHPTSSFILTMISSPTTFL